MAQRERHLDRNPRGSLERLRQLDIMESGTYVYVCVGRRRQKGSNVSGIEYRHFSRQSTANKVPDGLKRPSPIYDDLSQTLLLDSIWGHLYQGLLVLWYRRICVASAQSFPFPFCTASGELGSKIKKCHVDTTRFLGSLGEGKGSLE